MKTFTKIKNWWSNHKPTKRRLIQIYAALLYNANLKGFTSGKIYTGNSKYACVPGLNCYSCPGAVGACPLGALQNALGSSGTRWPFYVFGIIVLFGLMLGRTICGFLCPMGLVQDLLYKIKSPKVQKSKITRVLSYLKYVILTVTVFTIPLMYAGLNTAIPTFCQYICPDGTLFGSMMLLLSGKNDDFLSMLGPLFTWKFCVLIFVIVGSIFIYRIFCRFLCPLGALYSLFCKIAMIGVKVDKQTCIDCGLCVSACKMDIRKVGDHECIHCGACIPVCPTKAITWKGSKIFLRPNEIASAPTPEIKAEVKKKIDKRNFILQITAVCLALVVLISAFLYYNVFQTDTEVTTTYSVGDTVSGITMSKYFSDGETYSIDDDIAQGKIIVLNFWYVTCVGCELELPYFFTMAEKYADEVSLVVVHSSDADHTGANVEYYVQNKKGWTAYELDNVTFTLDNDGEDSVYYAFDGNDSYPMTVIIDQNGVMQYRKASSMEEDELIEAVESLL